MPLRRILLRAARMAGAVLLFVPFAVPASAQIDGQIPDPATAELMLRNNPTMQQQLRERILRSGLSEEQIRQRLRAAGYPESMLDQYVGAQRGQTSPLDDQAALDAVRALGLVGAPELDSLEMMLNRDVWLPPYDPYLRDSLRADSLGIPWTRPLEIFGLEVFRARTSRFQPTLQGPVDDSYRLGPGDRLALILTGEVERALSLDVSRDGFIIIPEVGQMHVANLTLGQFEDQLYQRLRRVYSGISRSPGARTQFEVTVARLRNVQVFVTGAVERPGAYQVSAGGTPLTALYAAAGPTTNASLRSIEVRRGEQLLGTFDVYDYLLAGINAGAIALQSGDVIFVPVHGARVKVAGAVIRPAIYEVAEGETLRDVIAAAGGFDASALRQRVQIHRILPPSPDDSLMGRARVVVDVGPQEFAGGVVPAIPMMAGDSVTVFEVAERLRGFVTVSGNVWIPSPVGFTPGMRLSDAIRMAGGPKPDVYLGQILVTRLRADSTRVQLRSAFVDSTGAVQDDIVLQEEDEITVFSRTTFRPERYVIVTGAVRSPGRIAYRSGMTVRDAILLANGLTEDAYLNEAELARVPEDRSTGAIATTVRVPLDSTYLFARSEPGEYAGPPGVPARAAGAPEVLLQPYDNLLILRQPEWELPRTVKIAGQVKYPGPYALRSKTDRLMDIVNRAGGLTSEAYPDGIEFYRRLDSAGRIGIDFRAVLRDADHRDNVILAAGDSIVIPEFDPVVMVRGAVNAPGAVAFRPGKNLDYYVRAAGGYSKSGDKHRAWVEQPNGEKQAVQRRTLLADTNPHPRPGAEIFVPERDPGQQGASIIAILGAAAQVMASLVTIIVVASQ
ncbi:MAG TPA: SLBB domain-containing protein [Gemmatimonadales bacterium]|nr:SLBB domain-containing protein [Gemmatimonadales bacterium]